MSEKPRKRGPKFKLPKGSTRTTIHLSPEQVAKAKRLGGTVAAGVRMALDDSAEGSHDSALGTSVRELVSWCRRIGYPVVSRDGADVIDRMHAALARVQAQISAAPQPVGDGDE